ncbi:MAG: hypothetical protein J3K34DRAFT_462482 [Monoraphidium minutum]|nr:MAG: hypothetical protein J3K34DRAFT_462482 [Monoraphidium minutum]
MWVLTPVVSRASQRVGAADTGAAPGGGASPAPGATPNVNHYLVGGGPLQLGRPHPGVDNDIPIHGDKGVSARHATIELQPAAAARAGGDSGGGGTVVVITDLSRFGTEVSRSGGEAVPRKLEKGVATPLSEGDSLKLSNLTKLRLARAPHVIHVAAAGEAGAHAEAAASAVGLGVSCAWQESVTHCIVEEGAPVGAAVAAALVQEARLVGVSWLRGIAGRKVWSGELPPTEPHEPAVLTLQGPEGPRPLHLADWQPPLGTELAAWDLVIAKQDVALCALAEALGGTVIPQWGPGAAPPAARPGRALLAVAPEEGARGAGSTARYAPPRGVACAAAADLVLAAVTGDTSPLQRAAEGFAAAERAALAAAGAVAAAGGGACGEEEDLGTQSDTAGGDAMEGEDGGEPEVTLLEQAAGAAFARRRGGGKGVAAALAVARTAAALVDALPAAAARAAAAAGDGGRAEAAARGPLQQFQPQPEQQLQPAAKGCGTRKRAAAEEPDAGGLAPGAQSAKRARQAAGEGEPDDVGREGLEGQEPRQGRQQQRSGKAAAPQPGADGGGAGGTGAARAPVVFEDLLVAPRSAAAAAGWPPARASQAGGPNFKAFRRKGEGGAAAAPVAAAPAPLEVFTERRRDDAEAQAFAREEQQRMRRARKADELFNANIKASKLPAAPKAAAVKRR